MASAKDLVCLTVWMSAVRVYCGPSAAWNVLRNNQIA